MLVAISFPPTAMVIVNDEYRYGYGQNMYVCVVREAGHV